MESTNDSSAIIGPLDEKQRLMIAANSHHVHFWNKLVPSLCHHSSKFNCDLFTTNISQQICNGVVFNHLEGGNITEQMKSIINFFDERNLPFFWLINDDSAATDVALYLERMGFHFWVDEIGMLVDTWNPDFDGKLQQISSPQDFVVKCVSNSAEMDEFIQLTLEIFHYSSEAAHFFKKFPLESNNPRTYFYIGYFQKKPVSMCIMTFIAGVATIYNVGTQNNYHKQGFGAWMLKTAFLTVKEHGFRHVSVQSSDTGMNLYKKFGMNLINKSKYYVRKV